MTHVLYKYPISVSGKVEPLSLPRGAEVLHFGMQDGIPRIWALVNPENEKEQRNFLVLMTGQPMPTDIEAFYLGTAMTADHDFVFHAFECVL